MTNAPDFNLRDALDATRGWDDDTIRLDDELLVAAYVIFGLAVVTVVTRNFFLFPEREVKIPGWLQRGLKVAPLAALAAVVAPEIVRVRFVPAQKFGRDHSYAVVTRDFGVDFGVNVGLSEAAPDLYKRMVGLDQHIADQVKATTPDAVRALKSAGLRLVMLTGDRRGAHASAPGAGPASGWTCRR